MYTSASPGFTFFGLHLFLIFEMPVTVNIEFEIVEIEDSDETGV